MVNLQVRLCSMNLELCSLQRAPTYFDLICHHYLKFTVSCSRDCAHDTAGLYEAVNSHYQVNQSRDLSLSVAASRNCLPCKIQDTAQEDMIKIKDSFMYSDVSQNSLQVTRLGLMHHDGKLCSGTRSDAESPGLPVSLPNVT